MYGGIISGNAGVGVLSNKATRFIKKNGVIYGTAAPEGMENRDGAVLDWGGILLIQDSTVGEDYSMVNKYGEWYYKHYGWEKIAENGF
ncbi:MAG: hypothetical protein LBH43_08790 [Treponema sp.]|jgi:hypothetical protein|nr:hypothetical protein [Treponema sp.]